MAEEILEPAKEYSELKSRFSQNAKEYYDELVKKSGIDAAANAKTVEEYYAARQQENEASGKVSSIKALKTFLIVLVVAMFIGCAISIMVTYNNATEGGTLWLPILLAVLFLGGAIGFIVLIKLKVNKILAERANWLSIMQKKVKELLNKAWAQMAPLNALFDWGTPNELIKKTTPIIQLDRIFDMHKFDYLNNKYGLSDNNDPDSSDFCVQTGSLVGNPFVFLRRHNHEMSTKNYTGELTVYWDEVSYDSDGNPVVHHRQQTLTATVTKPYPIYWDSTALYYGNDAAPDLSFSRSPSGASEMSDKQIERAVKSGEKALHKKARKAVAQGGTFTEMGNSEFDVLFGATDRDHETQFRLLFTPLAQRNILQLIKNKEPFGDDFMFNKVETLNSIVSRHAQNWEMDTNPSRYVSFDLAESRRKFMNFNEQYFESVFFDLAPLLSIPLYQQNKPREYIYQDSYNSNCCSYEAEVMANSFDESVFAHPDAAMPSILKTTQVGRSDNCDHILVTANSYVAYDRVDYVPRLCRNGNTYDVPVPWVEYIPCSKDTMMGITDIELGRFEYNLRRNEAEFENFQAGFVAGGSTSYQRGLFAFIENKAVGNPDESIKAAFKPYSQEEIAKAITAIAALYAVAEEFNEPDGEAKEAPAEEAAEATETETPAEEVAEATEVEAPTEEVAEEAPVETEAAEAPAEEAAEATETEEANAEVSEEANAEAAATEEAEEVIDESNDSENK